MQKLNDALAINSGLGCPDYFMTMTANLQWVEKGRVCRPKRTDAGMLDAVV